VRKFLGLWLSGLCLLPAAPAVAGRAVQAAERDNEGAYVAAEHFCRRSLRIRELHLGPGHPRVRLFPRRA
jgi:hypothetical protein